MEGDKKSKHAFDELLLLFDQEECIFPVASLYLTGLLYWLLFLIFMNVMQL